MREFARRTGKRLLRFSPYVHTLIVVAIFIELGANFFVGFYSANERPVEMLLASILFGVSAWLYLPIIAEADRFFRQASARQGPGFDDVLNQLLDLENQSDVLVKVAWRFLLSGIFLVVAFIFLFHKELAALPNKVAAEYAQPILNGLISGSLYALVAVSFNLIYSTSRFFHFAHSAVIAVGAYGAYQGLRFGAPEWVAWILGVALAAATGFAMHRLTYVRLRQRGGQPVELLLSSLGMMVAAQALISLLFGDDARVLRVVEASIGRIVFSGARLSEAQIAIGCVSIGLIVLLVLFLKFSRAGSLMRAVANDPRLAHVVGAPVEAVLGTAFVCGSALAGIAGILAAYDGGLTPYMGLRVFLLGVSAAIIGGIGSNFGALCGGLLIGLAQNVGAVWLPTQWQDVTIFLVLIGFLMLRPRGFFGKGTHWVRY